MAKDRKIFLRNLLLGGLAGGALAAVTALLLAPKSGRELRKDLAHPLTSRKSTRSKAQQAKKKSRALAGQAHDATHSHPQHAASHSHAAHRAKAPKRKRDAPPHSSINHSHSHG